MHLTQPSLLFSSLLAGALSAAVPTPDSHSSANPLSKRTNPSISSNPLSKRADPTIGGGIDQGNDHQGGRLLGTDSTNGVFAEAYELMSYATTTASDATNNAVFAKYFNSGDKDTVLAVFAKLLGGADVTGGAAEMANIKVTGGEVEQGDPAPAALAGFTDPDPELILSEDAWVYPDRDTNPNSCADFAKSGMTQDMYLLASILLHEYTHWDNFLSSIHKGEIIDQPQGYGWEQARALDKALAPFNADSYGWYATELFWAVICEQPEGYNAPGVESPSPPSSPGSPGSGGG